MALGFSGTFLFQSLRTYLEHKDVSMLFRQHREIFGYSIGGSDRDIDQKDRTRLPERRRPAPLTHPMAIQVTIGILGEGANILPWQSNNAEFFTQALQGAFAEHHAAILRLSLPVRPVVVLVRTPEELAVCDGLIIPGGESTTIALLARLSGLLDPLREFVKVKPVWGTCAGAILLAHSGGQELLQGISISIARNGWGSQVESFEVPLSVEGMNDAETPFLGVFIRAPRGDIFEATPSVSLPETHQEYTPIQVLARLPAELLPPALSGLDDSDPKTIVALRQGHHLLTTFHPELTPDDRFHEYFVRHCVLSAI
ncbi:SNO glutamine amidotransferase [Armillaria luteobubalina]|uniref:glutaminase n=1 Tax=Armillaria luteobubalina TaxID=153913 RepID=A0AA39UQB9_9AGAR|nr:SNO glutamine amidotransferase [Armillaria luteobubalina]